ncbi:MAG: ribonuclease III [Candidatus Dojkabacteria bacterium]
MDDKKLQNLIKILGHKVDTDLLKVALTHRSYINEVKNRALEHNERLEFLGDAVLELAVTEYLFGTHKDLNEGILTSFRAALVKTESLAEEAKRLGVGEFIFMSKGEEQSGGRDRQYILANTMEAIVGSIHLSLGYKAAEEFILKNICYKLPKIIEGRSDIDSKSRLQEVAQETAKFTPRYELVTAVGPDHNKIFEMSVFIDTYNFGVGKGKSKQEAEQNAALDALNNWDKLAKKYFKKN